MNRFRIYLIALVAVVAPLAFAPRAEAQTITACSANKSGSMYRVGVSGAPSDCTNANHKKETWNVQGPQGPQGVAGVSGYEIVTVDATLLASQFGAWNNVNCPSGKRVIGGGVSADGSFNGFLKLSQSGPKAAGDGWEVAIQNTATIPVSFKIRAICATVAP